ncbi:hypothetical protein WA026_005779 [Henosepilachna vigintioctopunctata]|uniref:Glycosyl hydrolase family 31 C-terminal domain-containing protein n=1 Tax=Henosepilachna vigintioctopunctata TaxID=420089 RepID=A0AAW1U6H7_9CUCU
MLTYGLLGYPLLLPAAIGGDFNVKNSTGEPSTIESLPDRELYIRWYQIASFMPVMKFIHNPNSYDDPRIVEIARNITRFRELKVSPLLKKYSRVALDTGLPIIRPLWMIDANDPSCHAVEDEFSIGDKLIVAPILYSGRKSRNIYLPTGVWKDGIDGSLHKGGRWINDYRVQENETPFFENVPSIMNI